MTHRPSSLRSQLNQAPQQLAALLGLVIRFLVRLLAPRPGPDFCQRPNLTTPNCVNHSS
jgi:hypothetical protein